MAKHEAEIRLWRDTLTANQRDTWNSPTSICNRCPAVRRAMAAAAKASGKPVRPPVGRPNKMQREVALDVLAEHLSRDDLAADERAALRARVIGDLSVAEATELLVKALADASEQERRSAFETLAGRLGLALLNVGKEIAKDLGRMRKAAKRQQEGGKS